MKIGFDFDAVLVQSDLVLLNIISNKLGYIVEKDLFFTYDIKVCCPTLSSEEVDEVICTLSSVEHTFHIPPYDGAFDFLKWYGKKHPIYIITNRSILEPVHLYLQHHLDKATYDKIQVYYTKNKGKLCRSLDITHFVDDNIENIIDVANNGIVPILFEQPWNKIISKRSNLYDLIYIIRNWNEIYEIISCRNF